MQLNFENVKVQSIEVSASGIPRNELATFWQQSDINLSRGLDFLPRGNVFARFTHLQHAPFSYKIVVSVYINLFLFYFNAILFNNY